MRRPADNSRAGRAALLARGLLYLGKRHSCPCCGWSFRTFVAGGGSLRRKAAGYCPRCNSKARHRRLWLYLNKSEAVTLGRVLVVSPHESTLMALSRGRLRCLSIDVVRRRGIDVVATATALPFRDGAFDLVISVHVLEHLDDDHAAIGELARMLSTNGEAIVSVPCDWEGLTHEDPTITSPERRAQLFGEPDHRRWYGRDITERLASHGLEVEVFLASALAGTDMERHGLSPTEHLFVCRRVLR